MLESEKMPSRLERSRRYVPRCGSRPYRVLRLMADGQMRTKREIVTYLGLARYYDYPVYPTKRRLRFTGEESLFSFLGQRDIYAVMLPLLSNLGNGRYVITDFGRTALARADGVEVCADVSYISYDWRIPQPVFTLESTPQRSLVKGLTWETSGLVTVGLVALLFTGNLVQSLAIGMVYFPIRVGCYFLHERLWKRVLWGHIRHRVTRDS